MCLEKRWVLRWYIVCRTWEKMGFLGTKNTWLKVRKIQKKKGEVHQNLPKLSGLGFQGVFSPFSMSIGRRRDLVKLMYGQRTREATLNDFVGQKRGSQKTAPIWNFLLSYNFLCLSPSSCQPPKIETGCPLIFGGSLIQDDDVVVIQRAQSYLWLWLSENFTRTDVCHLLLVFCCIAWTGLDRP